MFAGSKYETFIEFEFTAALSYQFYAVLLKIWFITDKASLSIFDSSIISIGNKKSCKFLINRVYKTLFNIGDLTHQDSLKLKISCLLNRYSSL